MPPKRTRRTYTPEFKSQMVRLFESGKARADIIREYDLTASAFDKWVKQSQSSGSFSEKDNRTPEENELIKLRKENQRLLMENDILKQVETTTVRVKLKLNLRRLASPFLDDVSEESWKNKGLSRIIQSPSSNHLSPK